MSIFERFIPRRRNWAPKAESSDTRRGSNPSLVMVEPLGTSTEPSRNELSSWKPVQEAEVPFNPAVPRPPLDGSTPRANLIRYMEAAFKENDEARIKNIRKELARLSPSKDISPHHF